MPRLQPSLAEAFLDRIGDRANLNLGAPARDDEVIADARELGQVEDLHILGALGEREVRRLPRLIQGGGALPRVETQRLRVTAYRTASRSAVRAREDGRGSNSATASSARASDRPWL